jgi:predicted AlkP superfamily pyrophosphatase or phosphodiesterase
MQSYLRYLILLLLLTSCSTEVIKTVNVPVNSSQAVESPYVILISIDGYRHDYTEKFHPPFLEQFKNSSLAAEALIPSFPSKTFPNHLSIVTGLYPEHHGIVANQFLDVTRKENDQLYKLSLPSVVADGSWYNGSPLWVAAEKSGMRSACFFGQDLRPKFKV